MEATRETVTSPRWSEPGRWAVCILLAFGIHAAGAAVLLGPWNAAPDQVANAPLIIVELEPLPVAPDTNPSELPPGPLQQAAFEPRPPEPLEKSVEPPPAAQRAEVPLPPAQEPVERIAALPPVPQAGPQHVALPEPRPPEKTVEKPVEKTTEKRAERAIEKRRRQKHASLASAPSTAERHAEHAAASTPGSASDNPVSAPNWKSELIARLERYKRYPFEALSRGEQGVAQIAFSIDRSGGVHHARITRSSGSSVLDQATVDLVKRAAPLPPPPPEMAGAQIAIVVPIRYVIR